MTATARNAQRSDQEVRNRKVGPQHCQGQILLKFLASEKQISLARRTTCHDDHYWWPSNSTYARRSTYPSQLYTDTMTTIAYITSCLMVLILLAAKHGPLPG